MGMPNFIYNRLSPKKKQEVDNKKNVKVIKEFLKKRQRLQTDKNDELSRLEQLRKNKSIDKTTYQRLKKVMILTHEHKRIDLIRSIMEKSVRTGKSFNSQIDQPLENNQPIEYHLKNK